MAKHLRVFEYVDSDQDMQFEWSGWRLQGMEHFEPASASQVVAHDTLEHFHKHENGLHYEMMAFGSVVHIRARGGWWYRNQFWEGREIERLQVELLEFLMKDHFVIEDCNEELDEEIQRELLSEARIEEECSNGNTWDQSDFDEYYKPEFYERFVTAMRWVSRGIRMAQKRWEGWTSHEVCDFFRLLSDTIENNRTIKHAMHGDKLEIRFDNKTMDLSIKYRGIDGWYTIH
jgi:hypothetical protein